MTQTLTFKLRLRDKHAAELNRQARAVNFVWNYCNWALRHMLRWDRWLSTFDLQRLTNGASKDLDVHAHDPARMPRLRQRPSHAQESLVALEWPEIARL
jgi:hypothetical protein